MNLLNKISGLLTNDGNNEKQISSKTIWSFIIQATAATLVFVSNIILARIMGTSEYGIYTFAISVSILISGIATSGFVNILIRRTADYIENKQYTLLKGLLVWSLKNVLLISIISTLAVYIFFMFYEIENMDSQMPLYLALACAPLFSLIIFYQSALNGAHFTSQSQLPEKIIKPILIITFSLLFYFIYNTNINSTLIVTANMMATITTIVFAYLWYSKKIKPLYNTLHKEQNLSEWRINYKGLLVLGILSIVNTRLDVLMLGFMSTAENVAVYNISSRISEIITFSLFVVNISLAPMISKLYSTQQQDALQKIITKSARITLIISLPVLAVIILAGEEILTLFGSDFESGYYCLLILSIAQMVSILAGSSGYLLSMTGNEKPAVASMLVSIIINSILNIILIPRFGIEGAACSAAISTIIWNISMATFAKAKTGINPTFTGK